MYNENGNYEYYQMNQVPQEPQEPQQPKEKKDYTRAKKLAKKLAHWYWPVYWWEVLQVWHFRE